jgi:aminopeptidase-like protein
MSSTSSTEQAGGASSGFVVPPGAGRTMHEFARALFPICRSITGDGIRHTLGEISRRIPVVLHEVPSGTRAFDWEVPREWNIRSAWIKDPAGRVIVDFAANNLHVVNYSAPVHVRMSLEELRPRLFSLPEHPDLIPYRTSYYKETWGFCLTHRLLNSLQEGQYEVFIDSTLAPGSLTYGECVLPGGSGDEVLVSAHACHPSLANDNLAGLAVATTLAAVLASTPHRLTYRFVFIPGTIGSLTWLSRNEHVVPRIKHGLLLTCAGDRGGITYKRSRRGNALVDRAAAHILRTSGRAHRVIDFFPYGYDERQYCSPGFNIPLGCLMRTPHGEYPEYHTSADNLDFIAPEAMEDTLRVALEIVDVLENDRLVRSLNPKGEPQLGKRGLYRAVGGDRAMADLQMAYLWVMNLADGEHRLFDMAERAALPFATIRQAAADLQRVGLIDEVQ